MANKFRTVFGIDPRSLAVFRIGLAGILLIDLAIRATDLVAHYSDLGVAPRSVMAARYSNGIRWSLHLWYGSPWFEGILFGVAAIAACALLVGWRSRTACLVSWLLLVSLHTRNPMVLNGGDVLLRMLLLWSMFLPLGRALSLDARRKNTRADLQPVCNAASVAILCQVCLMYWMTGYFKLRGVWLSDTGFAEVLQFESYAKSLAYQLLQFPQLLWWLGVAVLGLEIVGPLLALSPIGTRRLRLVLIPSFWLLHLGIELSLTVGLFGWVSMLAWLLFLPDTFWNALFNRWTTVEIAAETDTTDSQATAAPVTSSFLWRWWEIGQQGLVALLFAYVVAWNVASTHTSWLKQLRMHSPARLHEVLVVYQRWNMFTHPLKQDGWFVVVARLADGRTVDLLRDGQPADWDSFTKPTRIYRKSRNHRWRKLYRHIATGRAADMVPGLCDFLSRQWNASHPSARVETIELHYMQQLGRQPHERDRFMQQILYEHSYADE